LKEKHKRKEGIMTHLEYHKHLKKWFQYYSEKQDDTFFQYLEAHQKEASVIADLNLDAVIPILDSTYCPTPYSQHRNPICMLRALLLMLLLGFGITRWVQETRAVPAIAVLCGFDPDDTPGIGTYYDFIDRIIDGPWSETKGIKIVKRSEYNKKPHKRSLRLEKETKKENRDPNQSQSDKLASKLLAESDLKRPDDFRKILEDILVKAGIIPSIEAGLIQGVADAVITGDGSIMETAASFRGKASCACREQGIYKCDCPKEYTSPTAEWCYDHVHDTFKFGDRYYHLILTENGHDFPLHINMPGGNQSDYTLSLESFDRFLKINEEHNLGFNVKIFCGDGHHDTNAHYRYFAEKGVVPVIPLNEGSKKVYPHLSGRNDIRLDTDGTPLCPAGAAMRRHGYNKKKQAHIYTCPAKRPTRRNGKYVYVFHEDECPNGSACDPESSIGPCIYLKSETDLRLFPPIPRTSNKYKEIMNLRSGSERINWVNDSYNLDRICRNADRGLVYLTLINVLIHAAIRYNEKVKSSSSHDVFASIFRDYMKGRPTSG
jgi:hypothetical protein